MCVDSHESNCHSRLLVVSWKLYLAILTFVQGQNARPYKSKRLQDFSASCSSLSLYAWWSATRKHEGAMSLDCKYMKKNNIVHLFQTLRAWISFEEEESGEMKSSSSKRLSFRVNWESLLWTLFLRSSICIFFSQYAGNICMCFDWIMSRDLERDTMVSSATRAWRVCPGIKVYLPEMNQSKEQERRETGRCIIVKKFKCFAAILTDPFLISLGAFGWFFPACEASFENSCWCWPGGLAISTRW